MKKQFDPFDIKHAFPVKRRNKETIKIENEAQERNYQQKIDKYFAFGLEKMDNPDYFASDEMLRIIVEEYENPVPRGALNQAMESSLNRLKYAKILNPNSANGKLKIGGVNFFLYGRRELVEGGITLAKQRVEWLNARQYNRAIGVDELGSTITRYKKI